jgi:CheY-like chemotaxis protein
MHERMTIDLPYVLVADDDPEDLDFFVAGMRRIYPAVNILRFENGEKLLTYLENPPITVFSLFILIDYKMPPLNAPAILEALESDQRYCQIPKIVWSTSERQKEKDECLALGAVCFKVKPITDRQLDEFIRSLECWITSAFPEGVPVDKGGSSPD